MEFARKQLEKYGWTDGKGLGKDENGISEPVKAKIKHSLTGVGYDPAADFTEHWWNTLYNKAASNIEVENQNGKTKKIRRKSKEEFEITNSTWKLKKKKKKENRSDEEQYSEFFVKTAVIGQGGDKTTRVKVPDSESDDEIEIKETVKLTDEELFKACQGRTAHKGARHGLRALGKLARIEQQELILLQQIKYKGYSHHEKIKTNCAKDLQIVENSSVEKLITEKESNDSVAIIGNEVIMRKTSKLKNNIIEMNTNAETPEHKEFNITKKKKKKQCNSTDDNEHEKVIENVANESAAINEILVRKSAKSEHQQIELNSRAEIPDDARKTKKKKKRCNSTHTNDKMLLVTTAIPNDSVASDETKVICSKSGRPKSKHKLNSDANVIEENILKRKKKDALENIEDTNTFKDEYYMW